jgi:hypothetical protein
MSAVDQAMEDDRPEKELVRALWVEEVVQRRGVEPEKAPIYVTLLGARGREIELLADRGVLRRTETGAIAPDDLELVVGIESRRSAIASLTEKFPGIKVLRDSVQNVLKATTPFQWPAGEARVACLAPIINLDLNTSLECELMNDQLTFPVVEAIKKIATIQSTATPPSDWQLFLTLDSRLNWDEAQTEAIREFLRANAMGLPSFADAAKEALGEELYELVLSNAAVVPSDWAADTRQSVLMTLVPKAVSYAAAGIGWRVTTERNLRYGDGRARAAMVTWFFRFHWDPRASRSRETVYHESLELIHGQLGHIDESGNLTIG